MAYVAVSGGEEAIAASIQLLDYYRSGTEKDLELEAIAEKFSLLVDKVMSESGLYAKQYAALALKQCEGSAEEAVFLLRAYRSTLKSQPLHQYRHHRRNACRAPDFGSLQGHTRRSNAGRNL